MPAAFFIIYLSFFPQLCFIFVHYHWLINRKVYQQVSLSFRPIGQFSIPLKCYCYLFTVLFRKTWRKLYLLSIILYVYPNSLPHWLDKWNKLTHLRWINFGLKIISVYNDSTKWKPCFDWEKIKRQISGRLNDRFSFQCIPNSYKWGNRLLLNFYNNNKNNV